MKSFFLFRVRDFHFVYVLSLLSLFLSHEASFIFSGKTPLKQWKAPVTRYFLFPFHFSFPIFHFLFPLSPFSLFPYSIFSNLFHRSLSFLSSSSLLSLFKLSPSSLQAFSFLSFLFILASSSSVKQPGKKHVLLSIDFVVGNGKLR
ncbi:hypothetical protein V8G54_024360 [Vigna mungo]|uniref:Transmembrane protein n=1 Tax=Vigna mungo TaxID=3915 RepID=A0AAQ3N5S2_VIGMU